MGLVRKHIIIMSRNYVIIDQADVSSFDFSDVMESQDSLRYNVAGDKTFVKYEGAKPRSLYGKDVYTHSEILTILAQSDWTAPHPE